ncbi:MAG: HD domain-containing protein, partial [bacterium]|nr:HD domain-containing protein [bacterium]
MNKKEIIAKTTAYVRHSMEGEGSGHDWWHVYRVLQNAVAIAKHEKVDMFIVRLAALLHDIGDFKFHDGDETVGPRMTREWLESCKVDPPIIDHVCQIVADISYKGVGETGKNPIKTMEGKVVQDADRLDAIGAVGIARTFAYGGAKGREIHNPDTPPENHETFEQYKNSTGPTINHFYEKLLLLKDLMNTETAKKTAEE